MQHDNHKGARILCWVIAILFSGFTMAGQARAAAPVAEQFVVRCQIENSDREASVMLAGTNAIYRYGYAGQTPELTLTAPLMDMDYRRKDGPSPTIDEIMTFQNGDTAYRFATGFRDKVQPDPSAYRAFGMLTVLRAGKTVATLSCREASIERKVDKLLEQMRVQGRKADSDGITFPNYDIRYPMAADKSPACEKEFNVDTCWGRGVSMARAGNLAGALGHYERSCDAKFMTAGCYEAGKLYLHNRELRNYARAQDRFTRVCDSDDIGQGPYACKYIGWMALTGIGMPRDNEKAWTMLSKACFLQNDGRFTDAEGCHFLAQAAVKKFDRSPKQRDHGTYIAYLSFAMGCADNAATLCADGRALIQRETARKAAWVKQCNAHLDPNPDEPACAEMSKEVADYDANVARRKDILHLFLEAIEG